MAEQLQQLLSELERMKEDPSRGDAVFRCGFNGALRVVSDRIKDMLAAADKAGVTVAPAAVDEDVYLVTEVQHRGVLLVTLRPDEKPLSAKVGDKVTLHASGVETCPGCGCEAPNCGCVSDGVPPSYGGQQCKS